MTWRDDWCKGRRDGRGIAGGGGGCDGWGDGGGEGRRESGGSAGSDRQCLGRCNGDGGAGGERRIKTDRGGVRVAEWKLGGFVFIIDLHRLDKGELLERGSQGLCDRGGGAIGFAGSLQINTQDAIVELCAFVTGEAIQDRCQSAVLLDRVRAAEVLIQNGVDRVGGRWDGAGDSFRYAVLNIGEYDIDRDEGGCWSEC